jgi:hypothetical protein
MAARLSGLSMRKSSRRISLMGLMSTPNLKGCHRGETKRSD